MILIDTNIVSELWRGLPDKNVTNWLKLQPREGIFLSSITFAELYFGIVRLSEGHNKTRMLRSLIEIERETFDGRILNFDSRCAIQFGLAKTTREKMGRPINFPDAALAATAITHGLTLATRNTKDFEGLDLKLINPFAP